MRRKNRTKRILLALLSIGFALMLMISLTMVASTVLESQQGIRVYDALAEHVVFAPPPNLETQEREPTPEGVPEGGAEGGQEGGAYVPAVHFPTVDFGALLEINPNIVAWLVLENTIINYPVVHWTDNDRYLHHLFDGTRNAAGTLFVDYRNQRGFVDKHTIIHGHNMRDGSMFALLESYRSQAFFEEHPQFLLITPEGDYVIEIFAGFVAGVWEDSWMIGFHSYSEFDEWIRASRERSDFTSDVAVSGRDQVITMSTCFDHYRYVLLGKLVPVD